MVVVVAWAAGDLVDLVAAKVAHIGLVAPIFVGIIFWAHTPTAAPILVAHTPELDPPGLGMPVARAQRGHWALAVEGQVLDPLLHLLDTAAADITADIGFAAKLFAQIKKFVRAKVIVLGHTTPVGV